MNNEIIKVVPTPNPDAYMFRVNETLIPTGTYEFLKGDNTDNSPLAEVLLPLEGVELLLIAPRFITVRKNPDIGWMPLANRISEKLLIFLNRGEVAIIEETAPLNPYPENATEVERKIIDLLNDEVRPAIAQDGGDLVYHGFQDGIVKLELIGACGSCPSSTATLQYGIQNLLVEEIPEVLGVEQI